jgi:hypothetical protein
MTKLEELKAALDAANAWVWAVRADADAASDAYEAAEAVYDAAYTARDATREAYWAELKKTQEENSND